VRVADLPAHLAEALGDRYLLQRELGRGGMATVYLALDLKHDRPVALKVLHPELAATLGPDRFLREIRLTARLQHPHILTVHDSGEDAGLLWYTMPFVEGESLRDRLRRELQLPLQDALRITREVADALDHAHRHGTVHRDIKPENILLAEGHALVSDFGIAKVVEADGESLTGTGLALGTPAYMSPEQALGEPVGPASDVFSLSVVLYEMAIGQHPFAANTHAATVHAMLTRPPLVPSRVNPEIPASLEALMLRMLERVPDRRPRAAEVLAALREPVGVATGVYLAETRLSVARHTVGREKERAALRTAFQSVACGHGLLLCVTGEPGLGKTTLVEEFLADLPDVTEPFRITRGRCSERLAGSEAYLPFLEALEGLLQGDASGSIARLMRVTAPAWYAELVPSPSPPAGPVSQERLKRELTRFLEEASRTDIVVWFFDDVHWADMSTVDLISYLASHFASLRLLLVASYRPTDLVLGNHPFLKVKLELQGRGLCRELPLEFLAPEDIERYVALEFPGHCFPTSFAALIHAKTEGSPLFMVDLLRYLRDRAVIVQAPEGWTLAETVVDLERSLPESVRGMIQRKIDVLSDTDRALLVTASVQGHEFDSAIVAKALAQDAAEIEDRLQALDRVHAFLKLTGESTFPDGTPTLRYRFVHVLYQNALYSLLTPTRRAALSAKVADALVGSYGEQSAAAAAALALLFEAARDPRRAADHFLVAARNAARVSAYREAVALVDRGLALVEGMPPGRERASREQAFHLTLGGLMVVTRSGGAPEVEAAFTRARELSEERGDTPELFTALRGLSEFYHTSGKLESALRRAEQALRVAERLGDPALIVEAHHTVAMPLLYLGRLHDAQEHLADAMARYAPEQRGMYGELYQAIDPGVGCRFQAGRVWWLLGYPDQALEHVERGIAMAREIGHTYSLSNIYVSAAIVHQFRREAERTRERAEAAMALAREFELPEFLAWAVIWRGWAVAAQGRVDEGLAQMREGLAAWRTHRSIYPHRLALLAETLVLAGRFDEALSVLAEALAEGETGGRYYQAELYRLKGELLLQAKPSAVEEVEVCFHHAIAIARRQEARSLELRALVSLMRLYDRQGRADEATPALAELYGWFTEGLDTADLQDAKALLQRPGG